MSPPNAEPQSDPMREMSADLSVTNELLESHCACCLVVLNMKLRRDFHLFKKLLPPTPAPHLHPTFTPDGKKNSHGAIASCQCFQSTMDTSETSLSVFLPPSLGTRYHTSLFDQSNLQLNWIRTTYFKYIFI